MSPPEVQQQMRTFMASDPSPMSKGALSTFADWQKYNLKRLAYRAIWEKFFESFDVFLSPVMFTAAFAHDRSPVFVRKVRTPEGNEHPFLDLLKYIVPASVTGCPATAAPVGLTSSGLPVGLQIMGPYLEDATPIRFAALLAREIGGFQPPPGYAL